ncbi:MFS transporter [Luedemannella helvata]|uniref:MFS transporter n=1 Tax=Luedemannella helvata TaxID=349315 RepID=A0ABN2K1P0_9ACTN
MSTVIETAPPVAAGQAPGKGRWIEDWRPEDADFWATTGKKVAKRNLIFSIFSEHLAFSVWVIWSILVVSLGTLTDPATGAALYPDLVANQANATKIFWLVALPNLIGAIMRFPYTLAVGRFGGRNWTVISALLLLIPVGLALYVVLNPGVSYGFLLFAAITAGFGGGNFASSMSNISYFYPERTKGTALGINAAGGNIGLSSMQLFMPLMLFMGLSLTFATAFWLPLVLASALCAFFFMNNLHVSKATLAQQFAAAKRPHAWVMSFLYIGTFGSFLGLAASFPATLKFVFPDDQKFDFLGTGLLLPIAFLGPLVGSLARPFGGWIADRVGGAIVTAVVFTLMAVCSFGAIAAASAKNLGMFITSMLVLFAMSGAGNGSTYRMIPAIFKRQADAEIARNPAAEEQLLGQSRREGAATLGMAGAIGAVGGFILPKVIGDSIKATNGIGTAFSWFIAMYVVCLIVTLTVYIRKGATMSRV